MPRGTPERSEKLTAYVQREMQRLEAGEVDRLPTYRELADQFGYQGRPSSLGLILKRRGIRLREPQGTPERRENLIAHVQEEIQKLEAGEVARLSTTQELAKQFGYTNGGSVSEFLCNHGINLKDYLPPYRLPEPSSDLAWFLGILSAGGTVQRSSGIIRMSGIHENVLEEFRLIGEGLFSLNAYKVFREPGKGGHQPGYDFHSIKAANFLGDLRRDAWARTIMSAHPWVINNPVYSWGFVNGFFEKTGQIYEDLSGWRHVLAFGISSQRGVSLLVEMLTRVGVEKPTIQFRTSSSEQSQGVWVTNLGDIRFFAQHVHSVNPEKENGLEYYRTRFARWGHLTYTTEQLIQEWTDICELLKRSPTTTEIDQFKKAGKVNASSSAYRGRFGDGSFIKAREELERIIREGH